MITPIYAKGCVPDVSDKWYCVYFIQVPGFLDYFDRYLTPAGWKKTAYYFETKEEAEKTFETFKDYSFHPSYQEMQERRDCEEMFKR